MTVPRCADAGLVPRNLLHGVTLAVQRAKVVHGLLNPQHLELHSDRPGL